MLDTPAADAAVEALKATSAVAGVPVRNEGSSDADRFDATVGARIAAEREVRPAAAPESRSAAPAPTSGNRGENS